MPSLVAFGRRWAIASDDFVFPELIEAFVRASWSLLGIVIFLFHYQYTSDDPMRLKIYFCILIFINVATTIQCLAIAWISARGTIMDPRPRHSIPTLLYFRLPLFIIEILWNIISTVLVFEYFKLPDTVYGVRIAVGLEWLLILSVLIGVLIVFNPVREENMQDEVLISRRSWSRRFYLLKIRQDALMRAALDDVANLVSTFFVGSNYVFSDILAGLLLVVHSPNNQYPPTIKDERVPPTWMNLSSAKHFMRLATFVYGWPIYLALNRSVSAYGRLFRKVRCCGSMRCDQFCHGRHHTVVERKDSRDPSTKKMRQEARAAIPVTVRADGAKKFDIENSRGPEVLIVEDNCCLCNTAAFVLSTEGLHVDLFFVSFRNSLYQVPFVVLADHDSESIVITIRGSCSLSDLITDLCLDDEVLSVDVDADPVLRADHSLDSPDGSEVRVHRGMLRSARYVFDTLRNQKVLEDMFVLNPTYNLVITGHSLGAGVASLLTLLVKQKYPSVRCFAFAPPGCVISENGQREMEQHVMSIVPGDDVVPRISYHSMHKLRENVENELRQTTRAKYEVLLKGIFRLFFKTPWELSSPSANASPVYTSDTDGLIRERSASVGYGTQVSVGIDMSQARIQLYAPGRLLYVTEDDEIVKKEWIDPKCLSEVKLTASAFTDHLPKRVMTLLERLVLSEEMGNDGGDPPEAIVLLPD